MGTLRQTASPHPAAELSLDQCLKCNICTSLCPVSAVSDLFPGPKYTAPQAARFRYPNEPSGDRSVDYCSGCRVCNLACPAGVKIAEMNARARARMVERGKVRLRQRLRNNLIARPELVGKLARPVAPLANAALKSPPLRLLAEKTLGIARQAPFPSISPARFSDWFFSRKRDHPAAALKKVVYFHGCSSQYYEPHVGVAAVQVLEANGFEVVVPRQNCCGLPLLSNGEFAAARRYHLNNVRSLVEYARQGIPIVGTSTSCTLTIKEEAPELLDLHDEDVRLVSAQTYDLNEFLVELYERGELSLDFSPLDLSLPYHVACQYRAHRLGRPGAEILSLVPGLTVRESQADCCGIAGTYGYKVEKYPIAMQVGAPLFDFVRDSGAPLVLCDSETCRWQITHATGLPAVHPVELLSLAYGHPPMGALKEFLRPDSL